MSLYKEATMSSEKYDHIDWVKVVDKMESNDAAQPEPLLTREELQLLETFGALREEYARKRVPVDVLAALEKVNKRIDGVHQLPARKTRTWWYAAAVLVPLITISAWVFLKKSEDKNGPLASKTESPANVRLTLHNGQSVELVNDKQISGTNGAAIAKAQNGILTYVGGEKANENAMNVLEVPRGKKYRLTLGDGTRVWLNAESSLSYPVAFSGNKRDVVLSGEAYFEVAHDASKPFTVHTPKGDIQVLGTRFDVSAYHDETMAATLVEGKVKVSSKTDQVLVLEPGQQALVSENTLSKSDVDAADFIAWKEDMLLFKNETLQTIADKLGRVFNYRFVFADEALRNVHCTLSLSEPGNIAIVLDHLTKAKIINYSIKGNEVYISEVK